MQVLQDSAALSGRVVAIVGLGLMGGSLALALRAQDACRKIIGVTRNPHTQADALARRVVDKVGADVSLVAEADVVVLATPVRIILPVQLLLRGSTRPRTGCDSPGSGRWAGSAARGLSGRGRSAGGLGAR